MNDLCRRRHPALATSIARPGICLLWRNAIIRCERGLRGHPSGYDCFNNILSTENPGLLADDELKTHLDPASFMALGLRPIPAEDIGLCDDATHKGWNG